MTWLRAIAAAGLSVLLPGAGHAVLRDWLRALLFAGLYFATIWLFFPTGQMAEAGSMSEAMDIAAEIDTMAQLSVLFVTLLAAVDAALRGLGYPPQSPDPDAGPSCPECGKELDGDLEFCHWCTTRLESKPQEDPEEDVETNEEEPVQS